ncbi:SymE family type I addiction module toxin [Pectobacterium wasabiae]|nr:SymE family type I addiction module toxin [Pectobacterium wasabiae]
MVLSFSTELLDPVIIKESGFITGMPITVTVERGKLVIETEINL